MSVPARSGLTLEDAYAMPDDGRRYEILDGELLVTPAARLRHQYAVTQLTVAIHAWAEQHGGQVYPTANVDLAEDTHLEPDVVYTDSEDLRGLTLPAVPRLVVEVSSPSTRHIDLGAKKDRYAAEGTPELWFVDLEAEEILQFIREPDGTFGAPRPHPRGDSVSSPTLTGLTVEVDEVLGAR